LPTASILVHRAHARCWRRRQRNRLQARRSSARQIWWAAGLIAFSGVGVAARASILSFYHAIHSLAEASLQHLAGVEGNARTALLPFTPHACFVRLYRYTMSGALPCLSLPVSSNVSKGRSSGLATWRYVKSREGSVVTLCWCATMLAVVLSFNE